MDNLKDFNEEDEETSVYMTDEEEVRAMNMGGIFSGEFTNIAPLYSSTKGPTELHTATRYGKRFVLKGLRPQFREDPIYNMALVKEFEIGIQLDHPNIRRTIGLDTIEGLGQVIILEFIDGAGLDQFLAEKKLTKEEGRDVCRQIASALEYMHSKRIFHRDLKPSNILLSHDGAIVKMIDFSLSDSDDSIMLKIPAGSRRFVAPELLEKGFKVSPVSDIYSFGVIMKELAATTGDSFLDETAEECLSKDPRKRPQTIGKINLPASHPGVGERLSEILSSKLLTYVLAAVCIALAALIIGKYIGEF